MFVAWPRRNAPDQPQIAHCRAVRVGQIDGGLATAKSNKGDFDAKFPFLKFLGRNPPFNLLLSSPDFFPPESPSNLFLDSCYFVIFVQPAVVEDGRKSIDFVIKWAEDVDRTLKMSMLDTINPNAESISKTQARAVNVAAGVGLLNVLKSNLGPRGTLKLLVGGAGQLKLTKDGMVLLKEMQIQHPTACLIARTATAQDDVTGDGTTSTVLLCGELMRQADRHVSEGLHPRMLVEGLEIARDEALKFLQSTLKQEFDDMHNNRDLLQSIAMTSLGTKVRQFEKNPKG